MKKKVQTYLTAKEVNAINADPERRREVAAGVVPGLYLVIQPNGSKSWAFRYRHRGRSRKMTLGRFPALSLAAAREDAADAISLVARGSDPGEIRQEQKASPDTFEAVATEFLERHCRRMASGWPTEQGLPL